MPPTAWPEEAAEGGTGGRALAGALVGAGASGRLHVARALPDVAGFQKQLDYLVPEKMADQVRPGTIVRVPLQGRRVRAWVTAVPVQPPPGVELRPLAKVTGWGPEPAVVELAQWAAWRWWGRPRSLLSTASPPGAVPNLPPGRPWPAPAAAGGAAGDGLEAGLVRQAWAPGAHLLRLPPDYRAAEVVLAAVSLAAVNLAAVNLAAVNLAARTSGAPGAAAHFPVGRDGLASPLGDAPSVLVVAPTTARAEAGLASLRRRGLRVALLPRDWAAARAGAADIVIGTRAAVWGPCPGLAAVVVLDAHDEALVQEQAPTWDAPTVAVERARRAGVPCLFVSPCPTLELAALSSTSHRPGVAAERQGWAPVRVVDTREADPASGLYTPTVVSILRGAGRVACILNRKGRAQLLACAACGAVSTCERCGAAVRMLDQELSCRRCGARRPVVCLQCGSDRLRQLRVGVARAREQLEALAGRPVGEVTEATAEVPQAPVLVGTESLLYREGELHRGGGVSAVVFLDFDQELLAPRYRAGEEALALLARASRLVGGRGRQPDGGGQVVLQTRAPDHAVIGAAVRGDPGLLADAERPLRQALRLPPFSALALLSGPGAAELAGELAADANVSVADNGEDRWLARAESYEALAGALAGLARPRLRARVEVGPVRV